MASYPTYYASDLAAYSGRPEESYPDYADEALLESRLLFKIGTCLTDWPDDPDLALLAKNAVLSMADSLVLSQPYRAADANPFSSESIASYSYSKAQVRTKVQAQLPTGRSWYDLAVDYLGVCQNISRVTAGSVIVFERDAVFATTADGHLRVLGPADQQPLTGIPWTISTNVPYDPNKQ